jgi:hypothetical protein
MSVLADDEPHSSLFAYFRIFAPLVDNHVIVSHVTRPIPTFADQLWSFPLICNNCWSFLIIFSDLQWFLPSGDISHSLRPPNQHHATLQKFCGLVKQLPRTPACQYIKIVRPCQHTTSAWWCRDSAQLCDWGYMPNMDMLNVGVCVHLQSLILSSKI